MELTHLFENITLGLIVLILVGLLLFFLPSYIAFKKRHKYRWIILAINLILGGSGVGWIIAFIWAVWPQKSSLLDPVAAPSGKGGMAEEFGRRTATYNQYARAEQNINFCKNCGKKLSVNPNFCGSCGIAIS